MTSVRSQFVILFVPVSEWRLPFSRPNANETATGLFSAIPNFFNILTLHIAYIARSSIQVMKIKETIK